MLRSIGLNHFITIFFVVLFLYGSFTQKVMSQCVRGELPFLVGETIEYDAVYNWGFIWLEAAHVSFSVKDTIFEEKQQFHFVSTGISLPEYDWVFKVRDTFESIAGTDSLTPYYYNRKTNEGGYKVNNTLRYNYATSSITTKVWNSDKGGNSHSIPIKPCGSDLLNAVYRVRSLDFSKYKKHDKIPLRIIVDGDWYDLYIRYLGIEILNLRTGEVYECHKLKPLLVEGTIFSGGEDMTVWVTNDANKIPVMVEAKILIGSVKAIYKSSTKLKQEINYKRNKQ